MKSKKILAVIVSIALITGTVATSIYAQSDNVTPDNVQVPEATAVSKTTSNDIASLANKEETVYVITDANGKANKVIVSNWLKNVSSASNISDVSELNDIENVKGEETYSMDKDNMRIWNANGNDIYYQGTTDKQLPVDITISYTLNGKSISAEDLAGKSGKVGIHFEYKNNIKQTETIEGKTYDVYAPFAMTTGMILDNEKFSNVEVSNGKAISDGERTIVIGLALPGLQESLDLDKDDIDIPNYVDITADVKDFELMTTITLAINDVFGDMDFDDIDELDELEDKLDEFKDGANDLLDGTSELYDGLCELLDKSDELIDGVDELYDGSIDLDDGAGDLLDGVQDLKDGAYDLNDGAIELHDGILSLRDGALELNDGVSALHDGTNDLYDGAEDLDDGAKKLKDGALDLRQGAYELHHGLNELSSNNSELMGGAKKVFNTFLDEANTQIRASGLPLTQDLTISNYSSILNYFINMSDEDAYNMVKDGALGIVSGTVSSNEETIKAGVTQAVKDNIKLQVINEKLGSATTGGAITLSQYQAMVDNNLLPPGTDDQINAYVENAILSDDAQATIKALTEQKKQELINESMNSNEVKQQISQTLQALKEGKPKLVALKKQLDEYNKFYVGLKQYTDGVDTAASGCDDLWHGASELHDGTGDLKDGTEELLDGAGDLRDGAKDLLDGSDDLLAGSNDLADGSKTLCNGTNDLVDGVQTLLDGCFDLKDGTEKLRDGVSDLKDGCDKLIDGVNELVDGGMELNDGMQEFYDEGVMEIINKYDDVTELIDRLKAISNVAKAYNNFSGLANGAEGNVKFIYKSDSIELDD